MCSGLAGADRGGTRRDNFDRGAGGFRIAPVVMLLSRMLQNKATPGRRVDCERGPGAVTACFHPSSMILGAGRHEVALIVGSDDDNDDDDAKQRAVRGGLLLSDVLKVTAYER